MSKTQESNCEFSACLQVNDFRKVSFNYHFITLGSILISKGNKGEYIGELNSKGEAHGKGTFTSTDGDIYKGTFYENKFNGYCKQVLIH